MIKKLLLVIILYNSHFTFATASTKPLEDNVLTAQDLYQQAQQAERNKKYKQAIGYIEQAEKLTPNNSELYFLHAKIFSKLMNSAGIFSIRGHFVGMRENLEKVLELSPDNIKAKHLLVELYVMLPGFLGGDSERAQLLADQLYELDPIEGNIANTNIYTHNENYDAAISLLQTIIALAPERLNVKEDLARLLSKVDKKKEAILVYYALSKEIQNKEQLDDKDSEQLSNVLWQISTISLHEKRDFEYAELAMASYINLHKSDDKKLGKGYLRLTDLYLLQEKSDVAKALLIKVKPALKNEEVIKKINNKLDEI